MKLIKYIKCIIVVFLILGISGFNYTVYAIAENSKPDISKHQKYKQDDKKFELNAFWDNYGDEYLSSYIFEALEQNPSLKIANDRLRQSQALLGTINAQRLPHIGVEPSVYPYKSLSEKKQYSYIIY